MAGKKIAYFHPFKKPDIDLKIQLLHEEAKARESSPYCARHFPTGGARCQECLHRQLTPEQVAHRDVQATLFNTPLPLRLEEVTRVDRLVDEFKKQRMSQVVSRQDVTKMLEKFGYRARAVEEFVNELFAKNDLDNTGVVFLNDLHAFGRKRPPRLVRRANVDALTIHDLQMEFNLVDLDSSGTISRAEFGEMLFAHGLDEDQLREEVEHYFARLGKTDANEEIAFCDFFNGYMAAQRRRAVRKLKQLAIRLFHAADADGDGLLSRAEVAASYVPLLGTHVAKDAVSAIFDQINVTRTGLVSLKELFSYYYSQAGLQDKEAAVYPVAAVPHAPAQAHAPTPMAGVPAPTGALGRPQLTAAPASFGASPSGFGATAVSAAFAKTQPAYVHVTGPE
jgi:Ca2+-binding EF-hand superfamily protein